MFLQNAGANVRQVSACHPRPWRCRLPFLVYLCRPSRAAGAVRVNSQAALNLLSDPVYAILVRQQPCPSTPVPPAPPMLVENHLASLLQSVGLNDQRQRQMQAQFAAQLHRVVTRLTRRKGA